MAETERLLKDLAGKIGRTIEKPGRLYFEVPPAHIREVAEYLFRKMGCRLSTATAMEVYRGLEVLYQFSHDPTGRYFCPRVVIPDKKSPKTPSIAPLVKGAEWIEREMSELFGITFEGHPYPERLLTRDHPNPPDRPLRLRRPE